VTQRPLRICLIATEYPGFGPYGGFGTLTRDIALGLLARGTEVYVTMPRRAGQKPIAHVEGIILVSYPSPTYVGLRRALPYAGLYRAIDADVYHSEEPSIGTAVAQAGDPDKIHIVTFQDPRDFLGWRVERAAESLSKYQELQFWLRYRWLMGRSSRRAHSRYSQAKYIAEDTKRIYRLRDVPAFLPNPLRIGEITHPKAARPTVCYLGRWDARKRPELFLDLAARFAHVHFIFVGACLNDAARDEVLRRRSRSLANITAPGWIDPEQRAAILDSAWILVNTSTRECLPVSYLEAGARKCAILSHCNADDFASEFGYWAKRGDLDDYVQGMESLLTDDRWRALGDKARRYVESTHEYDKVIDQHLSVYRTALASRQAKTGRLAPHDAHTAQ
jgi:glycosyltransferase involved in cell wall biosynthesis